MSPRARDALIVALVAILAFLGALLGDLAHTDTVEPPGTATQTKVDGADSDKTADDTLDLDPKVVKQSAPELEKHLVNPPVTTPQKELDAAAEQQRLIAQTEKPLPTAGASQSFPGCVTRFVRNQSSRGGVRPKEFVLHYTVSRNVTGWADVNAIVGLFNRPSFSASSHFVLDAEGHCAYIVPIENKSWTQAALNPISISVEVIALGTERAYLGEAGYRQLASIAKTVRSRTGIPTNRRGSVSGCRAIRAGTIQHADGGLCSGGHHDINPFSMGVSIAKISSGGASAPLLNAKERKIIARNYLHRPGKGPKKWRHFWCNKNTLQRRAIVKGAKKSGSWQSKQSKKLHRAYRHRALSASYEKRCK